ERALSALSEVCAEPAHQAIAEIALSDRSAGELVGDLERRRALGEGPGTGKPERKRGDGAREQTTASQIHVSSSGWMRNRACRIDRFVYRKHKRNRWERQGMSLRVRDRPCRTVPWPSVIHIVDFLARLRIGLHTNVGRYEPVSH